MTTFDTLNPPLSPPPSPCPNNEPLSMHPCPQLPLSPPQDLKKPELLYKSLGAKLAVGMPFKDIATSDSILLREVPPAADAEARRALRRLAVSPADVTLIAFDIGRYHRIDVLIFGSERDDSP